MYSKDILYRTKNITQNDMVAYLESRKWVVEKQASNTTRWTNDLYPFYILLLNEKDINNSYVYIIDELSTIENRSMENILDDIENIKKTASNTKTIKVNTKCGTPYWIVKDKVLCFEPADYPNNKNVNLTRVHFVKGNVNFIEINMNADDFAALLN